MRQRHDRPWSTTASAMGDDPTRTRTTSGTPATRACTGVADAAAAWLRDAARGGDPVDLLTPHPSLGLGDGYEIQERMFDERCRAGELMVGAAVSAIGPTKPRAIPDDEPSYRWLTDAMHVDADVGLPRSSVLAPRVQPAIAFIVDRDLAAPETSAADVLDACSSALPALVVIDYRLRQPVVRPGDVVAICAATSRFVLGEGPVPLEELDLSSLACVLERDGDTMATAAAYELPGEPAEGAALLTRWAVASRRTIESGMVMLSGGLCGSVPVDAGETVAAHFAQLGDVQLTCR